MPINPILRVRRWRGIDAGMTIALDASSTCWFLARQLPDINLTVFTNSHLVCVELGRRERIQLISAGGQLLRQYGYYVNPRCYRRSNPLGDRSVYFSCEGIDNDGVLWDSSVNNAAYKSLLLKRAAQSYCLSTK